jgi:hypothetical protein
MIRKRTTRVSYLHAISASSLIFAFLCVTAHLAAGANPQWQQIAVAGPSPRGEFGFAFDSARNVSVLFGGSNNLNFTGVNSQTWQWNGTSWNNPSNTGPSTRCDQAMAFDSARGVVVSFGGYRGTYLADTWEWNGATWTNRVVTGPGARADSFMVYDSKRGVMVLFGGQSSSGAILGDTWEWNGTQWSLRTNSGPPARWIQRMAYDSARGVTVMFGGADPSGVRGDTWEWDGTTWTQRNPTTSPPARYGQAMAFNVERGVTELFGGQTGFAFGAGVLGDTWQWDGNNWTQVPIAGPAARSFTKMVYDSNRHRTVLFGGYNGTQFVGDTWELVVPEPTGAAGIFVLLYAAVGRMPPRKV